MFGFSDLEERLLGDNGSEALAETLGTIRAIRTELQEGMDLGLDQEDFAQAEILLSALNAAEQIMIDTTHLKGA